MTRLILIRHGQTSYNVEGKYCGFSNPPLNDKGVWQSKKLMAKLKDLRIDKIYSSDLRRAYETAEIIFKNKPIKKLSAFREMNFGVFEDLKYEEVIEKYPELYKNWIDNPIEVRISNGERLEDLSRRVKEKLFFILSQHPDGTIALISHGGPIRIILCDALKFDLEIFWQIEQENGALNIIDYSNKASPRVVKMNDTSHLSIQEPIIL